MAAMAPPPLKYRPCHNGLVSEEALRIIVEAKACFVALALALAYFLTASQHRLWSSSHLVKGFLFAVTQPVTRFLVGMFTMLLAMPFRNDLYLLWGILLLAGYEGVYTISGYCVSARRSDLAVHEFARAYNIVTLGLYVRYYSRASQFLYPLWALWALMVAKFLERVVRFKIANGRYGDANTSFVADYMKNEDKIEKSNASSTNDQDFFSLEDCNYLIVGDSKSKDAHDSRTGNGYEPRYEPADDTVTVAKVWKWDGQVSKGDTELPTSSVSDSGKRIFPEELKDVCLSFALCKLLRRKFTGVATAESEKPKAQRLVFDNLIRSGWQRTFRVVRTELGFARDLLYTKYPILFSSGFPVVSTVLFAVTLGVSVWIIVSAVRHYRIPHGSTSYVVHGRNVDLLITFGIVGMVMGMEICEFFIHLFSDWTKVMVISEYVRKPWLNCCFLNCILRFICCGKIAEPIGSSLGQFDLLKATKNQRRLPECIVKPYYTARSFVLLTDDEDFRINKCKTLRPVPAPVEEMICDTLVRNRDGLIGGQERLKRRADLEGHENLSTYCKAQTHIERIMVWHVATSKLQEDDDQNLRTGGSKGRRMEGERSRNKGSSGSVHGRSCGEGTNGLESSGRSGEGKNDLECGDRSGEEKKDLEGGCRSGEEKKDLDYKLVATTLSRYCAYLVFYKPKLLPIASNSVRYMCNELVREASSKKDPNVSQDAAAIVRRGRQVAKFLPGCVQVQEGDELWKALAEMWCELIVSMAPLGNIGAHQKELGKGGEFITHLWALLYHAGIDDKFSGSSTGAADAAPSKEDDHGQGQTHGAAISGSGGSV
ncbi:hypothetical protein BAE44_0018983 [Dichanthelium oligosanthes]|uniref:DUF4220 domain-containing protein n=1 Tax=Dichanthelium oligosanthes TaxID=888268 RepID=A0A1E5V4G7_9POAL|nr:hypothetical protein BAE44_0018983 [Dichanthelium oligosanthes]